MTIYRCQIRGQYSTAYNWSFAFHCESTAAESTIESTLSSAFTTFWTTATNGYENLCSTAVSVFEASAATLNPSLQLLSITRGSLSLAGTDAGGSLPYHTGALVALYNPAADTKSNRGRFRLPAPSKAQETAGALTSAFLTSVKTVLDPFWTSMNALPAFQVTTYNRRVNKQGEAAFTKHVLPNYRLSNKPASMRQRVRKQLATYPDSGTT